MVVIDSELKAKKVQKEKPQASEDGRGFFVTSEDIEFRPMTMSDIDDVMVIERTSYRFPWSTGFFLQELQVACARSILVELHGRIVGYVLYWLLPGALDIHNIAVHVDFRRRGIARLLLGHVLSQAKAQSMTRVMLEVRKSNLAAQKLYETFGFSTTGVRKGYYSDDGEDALAMTLEVND
jgi:ribosomal-protein-alanine N-acetyltransferase